MTSPLVLRLDDMTPIHRGNGIQSFPFVGSSTGSHRLLTGMTVIPPDAGIPLHSHSSEEFILVLEGSAICEINGVRHRLGPLDATYVPQAVNHRFINGGQGPMRILWVYPDIDMNRTLVESGEVLSHLDPYPSDASDAGDSEIPDGQAP